MNDNSGWLIVVLSIISVNYNTIALTKVTAELWEHRATMEMQNNVHSLFLFKLRDSDFVQLFKLLG